jgi:hypothetical protein
MPRDGRRGVDPRQTVQRALSERRGIVSQADITETQRAVQRLGGVAEAPNDIPDNLNVARDITWGGGGGMRWVIDGDAEEFGIYGVGPSGETPYFFFNYEPGAAGFQAVNLATALAYFALGSSTPTDDPYLALYDAALRIYDAAGSTLTFSVDPNTGTVMATGDFSADGDVTLGSGSPDQITIAGHLGASGSAPTITVGAGAGSTGAVSTLFANDTRGVFTVTPGGAGIAAGVLATISWIRTRDDANYVVIVSAGDADAAGLGLWVNQSGQSTTACTVRCTATPVSGTGYTIEYFCID